MKIYNLNKDPNKMNGISEKVMPSGFCFKKF